VGPEQGEGKDLAKNDVGGQEKKKTPQRHCGSTFLRAVLSFLGQVGPIRAKTARPSNLRSELAIDEGVSRGFAARTGIVELAGKFSCTLIFKGPTNLVSTMAKLADNVFSNVQDR
jgi:hypothetical protein